jgi:acid phosphatase type 7
MLGFLANYSRHMIDTQGRLIPMVACPGNHEVAGGYGQPRSAAPLFLSLFDGLFRDTTYAALDFGDYLSLVLLDTGHIAPIAGEQTDWLDRTLRERAERPHLIVVNHVPAYPSYRPPDGADGTGAGNRRHWVPLFEKHNVDVVLEHHDHTFKRTHPLRDGHIDRDGIVYLGDGSWGQLRAPNSPESRPYLAATGQAYHVTLHRLEGYRRVHQALEESGKVVDVCATAKRPRHRQPG